MKWALTAVTADDHERLDAIAQMHMDLLDFGPMAPLGKRFVRTIGYQMPIHDGLMSVACIEVDGRLAGFIGYTEQAKGFFSAALRAHPFKLCGLLLLAVLQKPSRLVALYHAARVITARESTDDAGESPAEITAIAAAEEFTNRQFVRAHGLRVSEELINHAKKDLQGRGVRRLRGTIDGFNKATVMMFGQLGATITSLEQAGEPMFAATFDLD